MFKNTTNLVSGLCIVVFFSSLFILGCSRTLVSNLKEYESLNSKTKYKILAENDKGFELAVYIKNRDFYTEERHLIAEAKNKFRKISKLICIKKEKEMGIVDENTFITEADTGSKTAHVRNWVYYK